MVMGSAPVAVITGGGTGIGAASAARLVRLGYDVVLLGRRADPLRETAEALGPQASWHQVDVADAGAVRALAEGLQRCDVLVNNAGGALGVDRVEDADPERWQAMFASNVLGTVHMIQAFLPLLRRSPGATIVNMSSTAGEIVYEGGAGYVAAKHGTSVVSETLRLELNGENIRVVDLRPGMVRTEEFSLTRLGDQTAADKVYEGVRHPLVADDVAACVEFVVGLPQHVNIDTLVVKPLAQAAAHKVHRAPIPGLDDV